MRARIVALWSVVVLLASAGSAAHAGTSWIVQSPLYLEMSDGVLLETSLYRPDVAEKVPVVLSYGPYGVGSATLNTANLPPTYAYLFASIRGTGCSGGAFDMFSPREARDGYEVVEWAGTQDWSNGKVGMVGNSYLAITQLFVAAQQPPHLAAIAPFHIISDLYRDVAYPGGILNDVFGAAWGLYMQPSQSSQSQQQRLPDGDAQCAINTAGRGTNPLTNALVQMAPRPLDDPFYRERSPITWASLIRAPALIGQAWQDNQVGSRGIEIFNALNVPKKLVLTNGIHPTPKAVFAGVQNRWLEYWLRGIDNGILAEPPVTVAFDTHDTNEPGFLRTFSQWPPAEMRYEPLYLRAGGGLAHEPGAAGEPADSYAYPGPSLANMRDPVAGVPTWSATTAGSLTFRGDRFTQDVTLLGPWALTLYASSTAPDTDFFALVLDEAPEGTLTWVQKGLLRASHRAVDPARSMPQHPYHTHAAMEPLVPGTVERFDVEMLPIGYVFRAGHRLRLSIMAPNAAPEAYWGYVATPVPGVNSVYHDPAHPSALWLPVVPTPEGIPAARACGELVAQSCQQPLASPSTPEGLPTACAGVWQMPSGECEFEFAAAPLRVSGVAWGSSPLSPTGPPRIHMVVRAGDQVLFECVDATTRVSACNTQTETMPSSIAQGMALTCFVEGSTSAEAPFACSSG